MTNPATTKIPSKYNINSKSIFDMISFGFNLLITTKITATVTAIISGGINDCGIKINRINTTIIAVEDWIKSSLFWTKFQMLNSFSISRLSLGKVKLFLNNKMKNNNVNPNVNKEINPTFIKNSPNLICE